MNNIRFIKLHGANERLPPDAAEWDQVLDTTAGLTWTARHLPKRYRWKKAAEACAKLRIGDHGDWRLPTRVELLTLVDDTRYSPAIDTAFFPKCPSECFWTSTTAACSPGDCAWVVNFNNGDSSWSHQGYEYCVRAVRSSQ